MGTLMAAVCCGERVPGQVQVDSLSDVRSEGVKVAFTSRVTCASGDMDAVVLILLCRLIKMLHIASHIWLNFSWYVFFSLILPCLLFSLNPFCIELGYLLQ